MRPVKGKTYQDHTFSLRIHLSYMKTILSSSSWNTFLDCARLLLLGEVLRLALPYSYGRDSHLTISSHIHDHHKDGNLQAYDPFEMAHLELILHFFFLYFVGVLKVPMRYHFILLFKTPFL